MHVDAPAVLFYNLLGYVEAEADTDTRSALHLDAWHPVEAFKDAGDGLGRNAGAFVAHRDDAVILFALHP